MGKGEKGSKDVHPSRPAVVVAVNPWCNISHACCEDNLLSRPDISRLVAGAEEPIVSLLKVGDGRTLELDRVISFQNVRFGLLTKLRRTHVIEGDHIVHVARPFVAVHTRVENARRV